VAKTGLLLLVGVVLVGAGWLALEEELPAREKDKRHGPASSDDAFSRTLPARQGGERTRTTEPDALDDVGTTRRSLAAALDRIADGLSPPSPRALELAHRALAFEVPGASDVLLPEFLPLLGHESGEIREEASRALKDAAAKPLVSGLRLVLRGDDRRATEAALELLVNTPETGRHLIPEVTALLQDPVPAVRRAAAWSLAEYVHEPPPALPAVLRDDSAAVREGALEVVRRLGERALALWPEVVRMAREDSELGRSARWALSAIDRERALELHVADVYDPALQADAVRALVERHAKNERAAGALLEVLPDAPVATRKRILRALSGLSLARDVKLATARRYLHDEETAGASLRALAALTPEFSLGYLQERKRSKRVWREVLTGLGDGGHVAALESLEPSCPRSLRSTLERQLKWAEARSASGG